MMNIYRHDLLKEKEWLNSRVGEAAWGNHGRWRLLCVTQGYSVNGNSVEITYTVLQKRKAYDIGVEKMHLSFIKLLLIRYFKDFALLMPQVILFEKVLICLESFRNMTVF